VYVRFQEGEPHELEDGTRVSAANVVVMLVERVATGRTDVAGSPVPADDVVGSGESLVFRDGRMIEGRWRRESEEDATSVLDRQGNEVAITPGTTWIELFPSEAPAPPEFQSRPDAHDRAVSVAGESVRSI
jgi:Protein of unknown function (DUF3048) C-terminal domain